MYCMWESPNMHVIQNSLLPGAIMLDHFQIYDRPQRQFIIFACMELEVLILLK